MAMRVYRGSEPRRRRKQRGMALILVVVALVALLAMVGLTLDGGHLMLNKTRLQNSVDASALAAGKTLDQTRNTVEAACAALDVFDRNANTNAELTTAAYANNASCAGDGDIPLTVEFSETLNPFVPGAPEGPYVRVIATDFTLPLWLVQVVGVTDKRVAASAVSGPSPTIQQACNVAPMMVCGDPDADPEESFWGYELNAPVVLKTTTNNASEEDWEVGPGNFQLIRLNDGQGGNEVRKNMAGNYDACLGGDGEMIETEPGNTVGPVVQGLNTRFGDYQGGQVNIDDHPPDVIVTEQVPPLSSDDIDGLDSEDLYYSFQDYLDDVTNPEVYDYTPKPEGYGVFWRRVLTVPFGDCSETTNGQGEVPLLGFGCFFLLQKAVQQGNESEVYGQFVGECSVTGTPGPDPVSGPGPYIIQLYKNPDSGDS